MFEKLFTKNGSNLKIPKIVNIQNFQFKFPEKKTRFCPGNNPGAFRALHL